MKIENIDTERCRDREIWGIGTQREVREKRVKHRRRR